MDSRSVISFDGVRIVYDMSGESNEPQINDAPVLVFVHGWTCNRTHWADQVQTYAATYRTIAIDLAGHGESGQERTEYSMPSFSKDVAAVLDAERVNKAVLVGHSMGGMVILHAAELLGDRIVGLVGADTFKYLRDDPRLGKQSDQLREIAADYESVVTGLVSSMFADDTPPSLKDTISHGMLATPESVGYGAMKGMADDKPLFDLAAGLDIPRMTINAAGRPMDAVAARDAGVDVRFLPTNGHFVMNEDPAGFNLLLAEVLSGMV